MAFSPDVHLIVGPAHHGVTEYALGLHAAVGGRVCRVDEPLRGQHNPSALLTGENPGRRLRLHVTFTDHLFGADPETAVDTVLALGRGCDLSVSFHDIPQPGEGQERYARRARAYARLAGAVTVAVTNSAHEAVALAGMSGRLDVEVVALPLPAHTLAPGAPTRRGKVSPHGGEGHPRGGELSQARDATGRDDGDAAKRCDVGVLGFLYPGKGHDTIIDAVSELAQSRERDGFPLPERLGVVALGAVSEGHGPYARELRRRAQAQGVHFTATGYLPTEEMHRAMAQVDVPVCPHRHVSASGSLMQWIAAGRQVLVADGEYTREVASRWPRHVHPVAPGRWAEEIARAAADPHFRTVYPPEPWSWRDVGRAWLAIWAQHWGETTELQLNPPPTVHAPCADADPQPASESLHGARETSATPDVDIVIPYYNDPEGLDAVLSGIRAQDYAGQMAVIIGDDGSTEPPRVPTGLRRQRGAVSAEGNRRTGEGEGPIPISVVRQEDRGFRAAAARNVAAAAGRGAVVLFLDGDTVPEPGYVAAMVSALGCGRTAVVVGQRRHVEDAAGPMGGTVPATGTVPQWLADGWRASANLAEADETGFRYVISATLGLWRAFFERIGGFDDSIVGYGGEDWELAWRAWLHGGVLRHAPDAVALHRGADWGARSADPDQRCAQKNRETLALAERVAHPSMRPQGVIFDRAYLRFHIPYSVLVSAAPGRAAEAMVELLSWGDCQVSVEPDSRPGTAGALERDQLDEVRSLFSADPRVAWGSPLPVATAVVRVDVLDLPGLLDAVEEWASEAATSRERAFAVAVHRVQRRGGRGRILLGTRGADPSARAGAQQIGDAAPPHAPGSSSSSLALVAAVASTRRSAWEAAVAVSRDARPAGQPVAPECVVLPAPLTLGAWRLPTGERAGGTPGEASWSQRWQIPLRLEAFFAGWGS